MADINLAQTLHTETDVSRQLRVSLAGLRKPRVMNRGPQFVKIGPLVRYRQTDLDPWLTSLPVGGSRCPEGAIARGAETRAATDGRRRTDAVSHGFWTPRPRKIRLVSNPKQNRV
jgi:hypothetical protein